MTSIDVKAAVPNLSELGMVWTLNVGFWNGKARATKQAKEVDERANAQRRVVDAYKRLTNDSSYRTACREHRRARTYQNLETVPWDKGKRLLMMGANGDHFMSVSSVFNKIVAVANASADLFASKYANIKEAERTAQGTLFDDSDWPLVADIREKFYVHSEFSPVESSDVRVGLNNKVIDGIANAWQMKYGSRIDAAMKHTWEQKIYLYVKRMAERLGNDKMEFKASLVSNVAHIGDVVAACNITGDPMMEAIRQEIVARLATADPNVLRKDLAVRAQYAIAAHEIAGKIETYLGYVPVVQTLVSASEDSDGGDDTQAAPADDAPVTGTETTVPESGMSQEEYDARAEELKQMLADLGIE